MQPTKASLYNTFQQTLAKKNNFSSRSYSLGKCRTAIQS